MPPDALEQEPLPLAGAAPSPGGGPSEAVAASARAAGVDLDVVHADWWPLLAPASAALSRALAATAADVAAGAQIFPRGERVLRALAQPPGAVRVLVVGQDPYPRPGHAVGLAFSVEPDVRPLPPTLRNLLAERDADTGLPPAATGDLSPWAARGVLLLNRVLTVAAGSSGSHRRRGWEEVTEQVVRALATRGGPLVAVLWGRDAQALRPALRGVAVVESAHPSPLSARRGFTGSRPFSAVDAALAAQGAGPVDWSLPTTAGPAG
ncbi:uracil-DNA glycosylase [Pseudokineococcus basanitobsidens]|uniref:Uracil-DNA glycosylase n=1 Tax=Pseudokineococcus basanitobsidens TaxID=1926649 RepID=A0ABU8RNZ9_9ACTN